MRNQKQKKQKQRRLKWKAIKASAPNGGVIELDSCQPIDIAAADESTDGMTPLPRASMVAYTGVPMRPGGWTQAEPVVVDLAGMQIPKRAPLHRDHDTSKVVGHSDSISVDGGQLSVTGVMSGHNSHTSEVVGMSKNGFVWQASIGAQVTAQPEFVQAGMKKRVNGRMIEGPVYVARKSRLREISFVSLGADDNTSAVAASDKNEGNEMDSKLKEWIEAKGFDADTIEAGALEYLTSQFEAENTSPDDKPESKPAVTETITASDSGADKLRSEAAEFYKRQAVYAKAFEGNPELIAKAIECNWDDDMVKAQQELVQIRSQYGNGPAIHSAPAPSDVDAKTIEAAMHKGQDQYGTVERHFDQKTLERVDQLQASGHMPRLPKLKYLVSQVLRTHGQSISAGMDIGESQFQSAGQLSVGAAFNSSSRFNVQASSGFSTISLPGILSNLMHKRLLDSYNNVPSVFRAFCRISSTDDFKDQNKYRVLGLGDLEKLGATGEIKHTELDEDSYKISVETRARMIALTRKMRRNDDLDALMRIPTFFGDSGARTLEKSVLEVLLSNAGGFFDATATVAADGHRPNALAAGASSALDVTSIEAAENLFLEQQDKLGRPIMVQPNIILASTKLKHTLNNLLQKSSVVVADTNDAAGTPSTQLRVADEFRGDFRPITTPWLGTAAGLANGSDTAWYMMASPGAGAVIDVAFLDGRQTPIIESDDTDFNTLGMQWRAYFDWGVAYEDPRFAVYSPGA